MLFSPSVARSVARNVFTKLNYMIVYSGPKPTVSQYIQGFRSIYAWSGNLLLQGYFEVDLAGTDDSASKYRIYKNSNSGTSYGAFSRRAGQAAWAVLFSESLLNNVLQYNFSTGSISFLRDLTNNDPFMIVPVSEIGGDGVLQFNSIDFVHPDLIGSDTIESFSLKFESS